MFFMGTYTPKLDDKGRLFLPAKFRDELAEGLVVTQGQERCLDRLARRPTSRRSPSAPSEAPITDKGGPRLHPDALRRRRRRGRPTSRAGSPSRRCCASTPRSAGTWW